MSRTTVFGLFIAVYVSSIQLAFADQFSFTVIDFPGTPGETRATGINNSGEIVGLLGAFTATGAGDAAFLDNNGTFSRISPPPTDQLLLGAAINNSGQVLLGMGRSASGSAASYLFANGGLTPILFPGSDWTDAMAINDHGQIVGIFQNSIGPLQGFLYSNGAYTLLPMNAFGSGINNSGQIVGISAGLGGFLYSNGVFTSIDVPGFVTTPVGINNLGQIVGNYSPGFGFSGFLYTNGVFTTIDFPGSNPAAIVTYPSGINDGGHIVGTYQETGAGIHGFVATLIPEPASLLLLACGLAGVGLLAQGKRSDLR